MYQRALVMIRC